MAVESAASLLVMAQVLVIEPDRSLSGEIAAILRERGHGVRTAYGMADGLKEFRRERCDVVVVEEELPDGTGTELLSHIRIEDQATMVIVTSVRGAVEEAVEAMKLGAADYLRKPLDLEDVVLRVGRCLSSGRNARQLEYLKSRQAAGADIAGLVGTCPPMRSIFDMVIRLGRKTTSRAGPTVLLTGETGTGKGVFAHALHYNSTRRDGPFVEVNCASIPEGLMEVEVFGAERGAFTGAHSARVGYLETADGGTLFLDEIGCLSLPLQAKLLTVLESRRYRRVGSSVERQGDIQMVVATNMDLNAAVQRGAFREDLLHRLEIIILKIPPLRERGADRMLLAQHLRDEICREYGLPPRSFADDVQALVDGYHWPGNVRELRNCLEQILLLEDSQVIAAHHFHLRGDRRRASVSMSSGEVELDIPAGGVALRDVERAVIDKTLAMCDGNVSQAARMLGITRDQLRYRLSKRSA